jgi:hypothetical protein
MRAFKISIIAVALSLCPIAAWSWTHGNANNGAILLVDGASLLLLTDGVSHLCRAGGC